MADTLLSYGGLACLVALCACGFPRPAGVPGDAGDTSAQVCTPNQALRCDGNGLVSCNGDGTAETSASCSLGCNSSAVRCNDVAPSNGLGPFLDMTASAIDVDLGTTATINTDNGMVMVDGNPVVISSATISQTAAPTIRVFVVHSLTSADVTVTGTTALAIVSDGDIKITGAFTASGISFSAGPGAFDDGVCQGTDAGGENIVAMSGAGGGGFGGAGGSGGVFTNADGTFAGGAGGKAAGSVELTPLRGGCDAGNLRMTSLHGGGGGAVQLVSRTRIVIAGVVAANGSSYGGGGSGGGILLEAPLVQIPGNVVANGAGGDSGCLKSSSEVPGQDGHMDATPAAGGTCSDSGGTDGAGGGGGARNASAQAGMSVSVTKDGGAGYGGGGVGRIRVNTIAGGLTATGVFSPNPSTGTLATR